MGFLTDLVGTIRQDLDERPLDAVRLRAAAQARAPARSFPEALRSSSGPALVAEVKRASPSAGVIDDAADPAVVAAAYVAGGAAAVSVLTESLHFHGSLDDLEAVRAAVEVPVLRKDFVIDPTQVLEARAAGSDSVLLIAECVEGSLLEELLAVARSLGMEPLLETHSDHDLDRALATDAAVIGVNARDLETLAVDGPAAIARLRRIPGDRIAVLESGIRSRDDVVAATEAGASAVLVGETLMRAGDPVATIWELLGTERRPERRPERRKEPA
jgi:indole-3-glycerol phosphate synthase